MNRMVCQINTAIQIIINERLWRTVKCEEVRLKAYATEARRELSAYFRLYNDQRPHQALSYRTPEEGSKTREGLPERVLVSSA